VHTHAPKMQGLKTRATFKGVAIRVLAVTSMITNWPDPWKSIDDRHKKYIERELRWELSHFADHPLVDRSFDVVAMKDEYENAIIRFDAGDFGYVRLTWKQEPPHYEAIGEEPELMRFLRTTGEGEVPAEPGVR
jgi:hypothetical protein